ncbi:HD domain-containing protein [Halobacteriales archaeon Cl-PHB]
MTREATRDLAAVRETARSYFADELSPAHDWHHVQRVESLAERLLESYPEADGHTVRLAVLLHDVGRSLEDRGEIDDHATWGASEAETILAERDVSRERIDAVCHAIRVHRYSNDREPRTIEAAILCDADNLDALGAVGVARCFTFGGELGKPMHDPDLPPGEDATASGATNYNHFHKKILDLPDRMYTEAGAELAADRAAYVRGFLERFDAEVAGER